LQFAFRKAQTRAQENYRLSLNASSVRFSGFDLIQIEGITLQPEGADTLASAKEIALNLSLLDLVTGKIGFDEVKVKDVLLTVYSKTERNNLSFLQSVGKPKSATTTTAETNYRKLGMNLKSKLVRAFNTAFELENIQIKYEDSTNAERVFVPTLN